MTHRPERHGQEKMIGDRQRGQSMCWNVTLRCNERCPFCFAQLNTKESLSLDENLSLIPILRDTFGVRKISMVGGEPLLYEPLFALAHAIRDQGMEVSLTTNAILLGEKELRKIAATFDWVTFSLDSWCPEGETLVGRDIRHFERIVGALDWIEQHDGIRVKINSLACRQNYEELPLLAEKVLDRYSNIERWKIFRFTPLRDQAIRNADRYAITSDEWARLKERIQQEQRRERSYRTEFTVGDGDDYLILDPDGELRLASPQGDTVIANIRRAA